MSKKIYKSHLPYPFAKAVHAGDFVFVSGQLPMGPELQAKLAPAFRDEIFVPFFGQSFTPCLGGFMSSTLCLRDKPSFTYEGR